MEIVEDNGVVVFWVVSIHPLCSIRGGYSKAAVEVKGSSGLSSSRGSVEDEDHSLKVSGDCLVMFVSGEGLMVSNHVGEVGFGEIPDGGAFVKKSFALTEVGTGSRLASSSGFVGDVGEKAVYVYSVHLVRVPFVFVRTVA